MITDMVWLMRWRRSRFLGGVLHEPTPILIMMVTEIFSICLLAGAGFPGNGPLTPGGANGPFFDVGHLSGAASSTQPPRASP